MKKLILRLLPVADVLLVLFVFPSAVLLKIVRLAGVHRLPICKNLLMKIGVFPIRDHYYEPQFDHRKTKPPFSQDRTPSGIEWNSIEQLKLLDMFSSPSEIADLPQEKPNTRLAFI